jgi:hypothetical protein
MKSVIYGTLITVFLASAGTVHAANDLDGKALRCLTKSENNPVYGLVFASGRVTRWQIEGYSKVALYENRNYHLNGTDKVYWHSNDLYRRSLNRKTLKTGNDQCEISSKKEIFLKLDEIIATAKKTNKL